METEWIIARTRLWQLLREHPEFTTAELAQQVRLLRYLGAGGGGVCVSVTPATPTLLQHRRPQHVQKHVSKVVEERIVLRHHAGNPVQP
ncbi:MAG: hypothetical protein U0694_15760 [Anaerolineae bacterium]